MLRHRADIRSVAFIAAYFVLAAALWATWGQLPIAAKAGLTALLAVVAWINAVITHNTIHSPMWRSRILNRVTGVVLSLTYGFPVTEYLPGHNLSHHRYIQTRRDVMRTSKMRFRWNALNLLLFFARIGPGVARANAAYVRHARGKAGAWQRQHTLETLVSWGITLALAVVDWRRALVIVFFPHLFAVWGITTVNYLQHDGCDPDHLVNHSRNFVGKLFNWFTFNNGFHGIHHMHPGLHWSLLPEAHAREVAPTLHPALAQRSLAVYLVRAFVWPGVRARYDGAPVVLPDEGPDEDWLGATARS